VSGLPDGFRIASAYVEVSLDQTQLDADLVEVQGKLDDLTANVKFDIDQTSLADAIAKAKATFASAAAAMPITFDVSQASMARVRSAVRAYFLANPVTMPVTFNISQASMAAARSAVRAYFAANPIPIPVTFSISLASMAAARAAVRAYFLANPVTIPLQFSTVQVAAAAAAAGALANAVGNVTNQTQRASRGWTIWGQNAGTVIHWIISGTAELLAVLAPATVAAASWAFVWVQGATNVYQHLNALFTATEALGQASGQTYGEMLGLTGVWQQFQNEANKNVYQALGEGIEVLREQTGNLAQTGYQVGQVFDTFLSKIVYDFSAAGGAGKTMNNLLADMIPDLTRVGEVFGNLGHGIASIAAQMPGLAEVLLHFLAIALGAVSAVAQLASKFEVGGWSVLTFAMAIEEFMRWGGLLVTILGKMGFATQDLGEKFLSWQRFSGVFLSLFQAIPVLVAGAISKFGEFTMTIGRLNGPLNAAGQNIMNFGEDMKTGVRDLSFWQAGLITAAAVGLAFLIDKIITARTATQQFADSLVAAVENSSNFSAINNASAALLKLNSAMVTAQQQVKQYNDGWKGISNAPTEQISKMTVGIQHLNDTSGIAGNSFMKWVDPLYDVSAAWNAVAGRESVAMSNAQALAASQQKMRAVITNVTQGATYLANTYHLSLPAAMELATQAGVKLTQNITGQSEAAEEARDKIEGLVLGYQDMGAPMGQVGNDMLALAIQSGEQGTKVQQLTQAWQNYMSLLTGGTSDLASFEQGMQNITDITDSQKFALSGKTGADVISVNQFAEALKNFGKTGAQAWQNFDQMVGTSAPQLASWLMTANSLGAVTGPQVTQAMRDMIAQMLPFAKDSSTAAVELGGLVQMAGGPAITSYQQLVKWTDQTKTSTSNLNGIIEQATKGMGNMAQIAENLGNVMNDDLTQMFDAAKIKAVGLQGAIDNYTDALEHDTQNTIAGQAARSGLIADMQKIGYTHEQAVTWVNAVAAGVHQEGTGMTAAHSARQQMIDDIQKLSKVLGPTNSDLDLSSGAISKLAAQAAAGKGQRAQLIQDIETLGAKANLTTGQIAGMISKILNIPKSEAFQLLMNAKGQYSISGGVFPTPGGKAPATPIGELTPVRQAVGGLIGGPGGPSDDKVPAWLSAGEYVVRASSVDKYGKHLFDALNAQKFAAGGFAQTGDSSVFSGQYPYSAIDSFETTVASQLAGATLAALHKAQAAAASSGGGGYAGPGGGSAAANEALARSLFGGYFPSSQWQDFVNVVMRESGFSNTAMNPSGAYGIAQALPASKYPLAGRPPSEGGSSNPTAQITWMLSYIKSRYGTPANAWAHEQSAGWYDKGGLLMPGVTTAVNTTGRPETVLPNSGGISVNFYGTQFPGPEQMQAFTLALTSAIANA
jgi:Transglycosylase SLT domain